MLLWRVYLCFYACLMWQTLFAQEKFFNDKLDSTEALEHSLKALDKLCIENSLSQRIPFYLLCFGRSVFLVDYDFQSNVVTETQVLGYFDPKQSAGSTQIYVSSEENCLTPEDAASANRTTVAVRVECCGQHTDKLLDNSLSGSKRGDKQSSKAFIHSVTSSDACSYQMLVCSDVVCAEQHQSSIPVRNSKKRSQYSEDHAVTIAQQVELRNRTRDLFYHAYSSYMTHAFPEGELRPVSCEGGPFELIKIPYVTLIDTLDTLVVMGDFEEFRKASRLLMTKLPNFDFDVNVSLFETTIRLLGGLLSAHLFSIDPTLRIYPTDGSYGTYDGDLLRLAVDLGDRLLPAFATKTGIPFGTVNLRHGVPKGETKIASTAGAGTLLLEFEILSILTSEEKYGKAALVALEGIYSRKSDFDLVGKHINTETGQWLETLSGVGSNSDSFYEYLLKGYSLMHHIPLFQKFSKTYRAIKHLILIDDEWFSEVDMYSGKLQRRRVENLDAFWPGMEALLGRSESAALQLNALYSIWHDLGFLPEELDQGTWEAGKSAANPHYALRPELVESTYYQYRATGQRSWLAAGKHFLHSLEQYTRTGCGFAAINDVASLELHDSMPSFFLSETCKYMYLLFDEDNFLHRRPFVLSTEAHPFDLNQLHLIKRLQQQRHLLPTLQEEITPQHEEARHMLLTQRRQRRKRLQRNKMSSMLMMSVVAPSPQQIEGIETATSEENGSLPLRCAPLPYQTAMTSSYMKILLYRDGSKLQRFPPLFSALKYLEQEKEVVPRSDEEGDVNDVLTARRVLSFRKEQLTRSLKNVITLLDHRKLLTNSAASTASEESKKCPVKALKGKDVSDEGLSAGKESLQSVSSASSAASEEIPATKVLELSLGSLGQFKIQVHPDGFHISNKQDDRTLDISNVGKRSIFVRESDHDGVRTMMARQGATVHSCVIEASINDSTSTPWRRHCALANFGPSAPIQVSGDLFIAEESDLGLLCNKGSASQANSAMTQVASLLRKSFLPTVSQSAIAALLEKGDNLFASKLNWWKKLKETSLLQFGAQKLTIEIETDDTSSSDSEVSKVVNSLLASKVTSETTDVNEDNMLSSEMTEEEEETFTTSSVQSDDSTDVDLSRRIVLVKRGDCLFEEKALNAQQRGGVALLVQNRENNLFIMAGKRDVEELHAESNSAHSNNPSQVSSKLESESSNAEVSRQSSESPQLFGQTSKSQSTSSAVKIPTVMVADLDARELIQLSSSSPFTSQISLDIQSVHSLLMSDLFGNLQYPKVWMTKSVIYVHTKGLWGAYFKSQKGEEWQMYLIDKRDSSSLRLIPPMTIRNANGVKMTTTSTLMQSPEQIYSLTLKRKCPRHVKVTKDGRSVQVAS